MWFEQYNRYQIFTVLIFVLVYNGCKAESNANFNEQIRDYSKLNNDGNISHVKTLQKENIGISRQASFSPLQNTVRFKEVPNNALSGSSHGRGLHHDHTAGYGIFDYEDPHYNPGYEYQPDPGLAPHDYHHYDFHDPHHAGHHVSGYGHHQKHYDHHALAAKSLLWPIAGIALLGAAAALISNPVLLQLGVVSGRKKRQTQNLDLVKNSIKKWSPKSVDQIDKVLENIPDFIVKKRFIKREDLKAKPPVEPQEELEHKSHSRIIKVVSKRYSDEDDKQENMIPVPLHFKKS